MASRRISEQVYCHYDYLFYVLCYDNISGDITQNSAEFRCVARLEKHGAQRMIKGDDHLYVLTGHILIGSYDTSIFRLDPGTDYEWTVLFEATIRPISRTLEHLYMNQGTVYHDHQIFMFFYEDSIDFSVSIYRHFMIWMTFIVLRFSPTN